MEEKMRYIHENLSQRALLEQLAEEAAELSQAALKLIRAQEDSENPTPKSRLACLCNLDEEIMDVLVTYATWNGTWQHLEEDLLRLAKSSYKTTRCVDRIKAAKAEKARKENE